MTHMGQAQTISDELPKVRRALERIADVLEWRAEEDYRQDQGQAGPLEMPPKMDPPPHVRRR